MPRRYPGLTSSKAQVATKTARKNIRPDCVIYQEGRWGILEVDGEPFHPPERSAFEHDRNRLFGRHGVVCVERFDSKKCYSNPDKTVEEFLLLMVKSYRRPLPSMNRSLLERLENMSFRMPPVGAVLTTGSISAWDSDMHRNIELLTETFQSVFDERVEVLGLNARIARGVLPGNVTFILDRDYLWLVGEVAHGAPHPRKFHVEGDPLTDDGIEQVSAYELGYVDPFFAKLPRQLLTSQHDDEELTRIAVTESVDQLITREYQRATSKNAGFELVLCSETPRWNLATACAS